MLLISIVESVWKRLNALYICVYARVLFNSMKWDLELAPSPRLWSNSRYSERLVLGSVLI